MASISSTQEANLAAARARTRQDKKIPFLIHTGDARLVPNTPLTAKLQQYRPYLGDYRASEAERKAYLMTNGQGTAKRDVKIPTQEELDAEPFDIAKAQKDELIAFAFDQYQEVLDPSADIRSLRKKVAALAVSVMGGAAADALG